MPVSAAGTAYDLTGPAGAPVVVLIHGLGLTRGSTWGAIAPVLAREFRVLSYDLCGHGKTVQSKVVPSLCLLSEQLIALMDELAIAQAALVGFSLGGMINRRVARDHPARVTGLGILNSPHARGAQAQARVEAQARDAGASGPGATVDAALERWLTPEFRAQQPERVAQIRAVVMANQPENYAAHRRVLAAGVTELIRPDPAIEKPALIMTCEMDSGSTPAMSMAMAGEIPGAEVIIVPGLQHLGLIEAPEAFTGPLLGFLQGLKEPLKK
jgi:pimeloyl-ACP methyl ester carboxylesterase